MKNRVFNIFKIVLILFLLSVLINVITPNITGNSFLNKIIDFFSNSRTLSTPTLISPLNSAIITSPAQFSWSSVSKANSYLIQITLNNDVNFLNPIINLKVNINSYSTSLNPGFYIWRVQAQNRNSLSAWSNINTFSIPNPQPINFLLNVTKSGLGTGIVTSNPSGINCGIDCSKIYSSGTQLTLLPLPDQGNIFIGWSGSCTGNGNCNLVIDSNKQVNAFFDVLLVPVSRFSDDFSTYSTGNCLTDGTIFGKWNVVFSGYGCVEIETDGINKWLHESPKVSTSLIETHSSLVTGPSFNSSLIFEANLTNIQQLRSIPNPWETAWMIWNYQDNSHFYYFTLKTNGWELGKEDPSYPGNQRYLATGASPQAQIGKQYDVKIIQDNSNTIKVYVDNVSITTFTDNERPYNSGKIALYTEDAHVHFDDIKVI